MNSSPGSHPPEGILLVDKPKGRTSFSLVSTLRRLTRVQKVGHAGTLDPFASGVMVLLIGKRYTALSNQLIAHDKEYRGTVRLGVVTDTFDCDGRPLVHSAHVPSLDAIEEALRQFQGTILQTPPMFSAKKVHGKKLYELARKGQEVERTPVPVTLHTTLLSYAYPFLELRITCTKGTYIRAIAHDLGALLGTGAHLGALTRTRSGPYHLDACLDGARLADPGFSVLPHLIR